jgi:parvulin-like peptidyl-prolyl isomerase
MSSGLKIGNRLLDGEQIVAALVQYQLLDSLVGQILLDSTLNQISLSQQEVFYYLVGETDQPIPENFDSFLMQWCQWKGVTPNYFNTVILRELRLQKFKQIQFADQVESEFLRNKSNLDQVEFSLIRLTDLALAQELYFQIRDDGADFTQLAQQHSQGSERETGGWVGPVSLSTLPEAVSTLFKSDQAGTVYGPIPVENTFWVVRLEHFIAARLTEATRTHLVNRLYTEWLQAQARAAMNIPGAIAIQTDAVEPEAETPLSEDEPNDEY